MRQTLQLLVVLLVIAPGFASAQNRESPTAATAPQQTGGFEYPSLPSPIAWLANSGDLLSIMKNEGERLKRAGIGAVPGNTVSEKLALLRNYHIQGEKLATLGKALSWMDSVDNLTGLALRLGRGDTARAGGHSLNWIGSTLAATKGAALVGGATVGSPAFLGAIAGSIAYDKLGKPLVDAAIVQTKAWVDLTALTTTLEEREEFLKNKDWPRADVAARKVIDGYDLVNQNDPGVGATTQARDLHARALAIRGEVARERLASAKAQSPVLSTPPKPAAISLRGDGNWKWKTTKAEGPDRKLDITIDVAKQSFIGEISCRETEQETDGPTTKTFSATFDGKFTGDATHGTLEGSGNCRTHTTSFSHNLIHFTGPNGLIDFRKGPVQKHENIHQYTFQLKATLTGSLVTGSA